MPTVRCPGCDESVDIESDWYGRRVSCPACDRRFTPRRPGADRDDDDEEEDDRPRPKRKGRRVAPQGMGRGAKQLLAVGVVGGTLLLLCGGCGLGGWLWIFAPADYSAPWVAQSLPDGSYTMHFPDRPGDVPVPDSPGGVNYVFMEAPPKDAVFTFGHLDNVGLSFDAAWQAEVDEIAAETGVKPGAVRPVSVAGCTGKEVDFKDGMAKVTYRLLDASRGGRQRLLVALVGGRNVSDADRKKFLDSLAANAR